MSTHVRYYMHFTWYFFAGAVSFCMQRRQTNIWAVSWENLFMPYANHKGAYQPVHPRSLISTFVVRCLDSIIHLLAISKDSRLKLAAEAEQTSLSLTRSETPNTCFLVTWLNYEETLTRSSGISTVKGRSPPPASRGIDATVSIGPSLCSVT